MQWTWPASKLAAERACWRHLLDVMQRYVEIPPWQPPIPWERLPELVRDPEDFLVLSAAPAIAELDAEGDADLVAQYSRRAGAVLSRLALGAGGSAERPAAS
ncbi:hypothetical protein BH20ACT5_BH20ACT5_07210 [soil metagenome]